MPEPLTDDELALLVSILDQAREGRTDELRDALDAGVPVNLTAATGDSLLMLAAYHDHGDTVDLLLERGADTERVNDRGQTALGAAVFRQSARSRAWTTPTAVGGQPSRSPSSSSCRRWLAS
jgi:ankyrin repeat protein